MGSSLHDSVLGEGPDVVLLHGLFGQGSNLGTIARALAEEFHVHSPDLPDHGHSSWSETASIETYAQAISEWMTDRQLDAAHFVGHSLGGKVAMQLAFDEPSRVDRLVIADIAPVAYPPSHEGVFEGMAAVSAERCANRQEAAAVLADYLDEEQTIQFLLLSLMRTEDGHYDWRLNREGLASGYERFLAAPQADMPFDGETLFIYGENSQYVQESHRDVIEGLFSHCRFVEIAGTGHWLHAEKPRQFNDAVLEFLV